MLNGLESHPNQDEIQAHLTWYQSRVKDCNVGIELMPTLGMRVGVEVGFEVVCSLLLVSHCSCSRNVKCINMLEYPHPLS